MRKDIFGIPCANMDNAIYLAIETVLSKIKQDYPRDFSRIRKRVATIVTKCFSGEGCFSQDTYQSKSAFLYEEPEFWEATGTIIIHKDIHTKKKKTESILHVIAHEFGHAMVSEKIFNRYFKQLFLVLAYECSDRKDDANFLTCLDVAESIYVQENIANYYAKKWGFPTVSESEWFVADSVALIHCGNGVVAEIKVDGNYKFKDSYLVHWDWHNSDLKRYKNKRHSLHSLDILIQINGLGE